MKVAIFGATGRTGRLLVEQCLDAGYEVVALVRDPTKLLARDGLSLREPDIFDASSVTEAIRDVQIVCTCLGANDLKPSDVQARSMGAILTAMEAVGIKRLIVLGASGALHPSLPEEGIGRKLFFFLIRNTLLKHPMRDSANQERMVEASTMDYTVVHPPRLTNEARTGIYRVSMSGLPRGGRFLSRGDLAEFMVKVIGDDGMKRKGPYVAY